LGTAELGSQVTFYVHLQPDSEVESMKKLEEAFFGEFVLNCAQKPGLKFKLKESM